MENSRREAFERVKEILLSHGVSEEEIDSAHRLGQLDLLVIERLLLPGRERITEEELLKRTGLSKEVARREWRALGFPEVDPNDPHFTEFDVEALKTFEAVVELGVADFERTLQLTRVIGSSMARIAESQVTMAQLVEGVSDPLLRAELLALAAEVVLPAVVRLLEYSYRRHLQAAARRAWLYNASHRASEEGEVELAVGFADMVGFTVLSQQVSADELAQIVTRFEAVAYDTVIEGGGRIVKMIGDEAMFVVDEAERAVEIAVSLCDAYSDDEVLSDVRVGLDYGRVLPWDGDYFGPTVNAASRVVALADPGTVLATKEVVTRCGELKEINLRALRPTYLKDIGRVELYRVDRKGAEVGASRKRRYGLAWKLLEGVLRDLDELREQGQRLLLSVAQPERQDLGASEAERLTEGRKEPS